MQDYVENYQNEKKKKREYIFLKNRMDLNEIEGEVVQTEEESVVPETEQ